MASWKIHHKWIVFHGKILELNGGFAHRLKPQGCDHANLCEWDDSKEKLAEILALGSHMEECGSPVKSCKYRITLHPILGK